jgi:uncharacterized RDD family membrane protein YckC
VELLDTTATVQTPERVSFRYRLAGPGQRAIAWVVDTFIEIALVFALLVLAIVLAGVEGLGGIGVGLFLVGTFVVQWMYGVTFETLWSGRTPGKRLLDLRVVRADGAPARFPDFLLRNLLRAVDFLPLLFGVGVVVMAVDPRMRRIGDLVAGTVVVAEDKANVLVHVPLRPPVTDDERQGMPAGVALRPDELRAIEAFLRRRARLSDERAEELARYLGPELSRRTGVVAPSWERVLALVWARATGADRGAV